MRIFKAVFWTIVIVIIIAIPIVWYSANNGWKGTISGTIDKILASQKIEPQSEEAQLPVSPKAGGEVNKQPSEEKGSTLNPLAGPLGLPGMGLNLVPGQQPPQGQAETQATQPGTSITGQTPSEEPVEESGAALGQPKLQSPTDVLTACIAKLKTNDLVGAERYVSDKGMEFKFGNTTGAHVILWKGFFVIQSYQSVGYGKAVTSGQTSLIPLYAKLGTNNQIVAYAVMAHRGDGWKLDGIIDPTKF